MGLKEDVLAQFDQDIADAKGKLFDAAFAGGVASVPADGSGNVTSAQEQLDIQNAVAAASVDLNAQIADLQNKFGVDEASIASLNDKIQKIKDLLV